MRCMVCYQVRLALPGDDWGVAALSETDANIIKALYKLGTLTIDTTS